MHNARTRKTKQTRKHLRMLQFYTIMHTFVSSVFIFWSCHMKPRVADLILREGPDSCFTNCLNCQTKTKQKYHYEGRSRYNWNIL